MHYLSYKNFKKILLILSVPVFLFSQTNYYYLGDIDASWSDPASWSPGNVPGEKDTAFVSEGQVLIDSTFKIAKLVLTGGNISGDDTLTVLDSLILERSILRGSSTLIIDSLAIAVIRSLEFKQIGAAHKLINKGNIYWFNGGFSNSGEGALINIGYIRVKSVSSDRLFNSGRFENKGGFYFQADGQTTIFANFVNTGNVRISSGHLEIGQNSGTAVDNGQYLVSRNAILEFGYGSGERILTENSAIDADGSKIIFNRGTTSINGMFKADSVVMEGTGANVDFNVNVSIPFFQLTSGNLRGSGELSITSQMNWSSGSQREAGTTRITPGAILNIYDNGTINCNEGRIFINDGSVAWNKSGKLTGEGYFYNHGTMEFDKGDFEPVAFYNYGKVIVNSTDIVTFSGKTLNHGLLEVMSGAVWWENGSGTTLVDSGEYNVYPGTEIEFKGGPRELSDVAVISGSGQLKWSSPVLINSSALVSPDSANIKLSAGKLNILNDFTFQENGRLQINIGGYLSAKEYDKLNISGKIELHGKLEISFINDFIPNIADTFSIVQSDTLSGTFSDILLPSGFAADIEYRANSVLVTITQITTDISSKTNVNAQDFNLYQNYPNPFNPVTQIRFALPKAEKVRLEVFNMLGQNVATLLNRSMQAGYHTVTFENYSLPSGIYFYRIQAGKIHAIKRMILLK